jgi:hypothetical protein
MANKSNKKDNKDKSKVCPVCRGTGKTRWKRDKGTGIYVIGTKAMTCSFCRGSGRISRKPYLRFVRVRFRLPPRKRPYRWPISGRRGRFSHGSVVLPPPGTPLAGWSQDIHAPKSAPESVYRGAEVDYNVEEDDKVEEESPMENILMISDDITITLGKEFHPDLVLDIDTVQTNFQEALEASSESVTAQVCYGVESNEYMELLLHQINPFEESTILQLDDDVYTAVENKEQLLDIEPYETNIYEYETDIGLEVDNAPVSDLLQQPHQFSSTDNADVLGPAISNPSNHLDVIGVEDPLSFNISTDITGCMGY